MKKLIALISPVGKTKEQLAKEMFEAMQKYFRVEKEVLADMAKGQTNSKSLEELMEEYKKSGEEQYNPPQGQKKAFVSFHSNKKNDKK